MLEDRVRELYFEWICDMVIDVKHPRKKYSKLLHALHDKNFNYIIAMDENREASGIDLRYLFGTYSGYPDSLIASALDGQICSVLEMMVALAKDCEISIMDDQVYGNRTPKWFWKMVESLGLSEMNDHNFDQHYFDMVIDRFLNREYEPNGAGGLFTVRHPSKDMRNVEIWYQMMWYLDEVLNE